MESEKKLYPLKLLEIVENRPWGIESFILSDLGYKDTPVLQGWLAGNGMGEIMDTYMDRIVGERVYEYYGRQFPVCLRLLKIEGKMPFQVHPNDEIAAQRYDLLGKEKLWYVLRKGKGARIHLGFKKNSDASEFYKSCNEDSAESLLNEFVPVTGQAFLIPSGVPHGAMGDMEILEIAESSPLDFYLSGRGLEISEEQFDPALDLSDAMDFISYDKHTAKPLEAELICELPQFVVKKLKLEAASHFRSNDEINSFTLLHCLSGEAELEPSNSSERYSLKARECLLVPAECSDLSLNPKTKNTSLLLIYNHRVEEDKYLENNQNTQ